MEEGSAGTKKKEKVNGKVFNDIDTSVSVSGRWPCGYWGCNSNQRCEADGICYSKVGYCRGCNEDSDCTTGHCNNYFQCSDKGQAYKNGCSCAVDGNCISQRCSQFFKCADRLSAGKACSGLVTTSNDCKDGLSCVKGKCCHEPRQQGEPCESDVGCPPYYWGEVPCESHSNCEVDLECDGTCYHPV